MRKKKGIWIYFLPPNSTAWLQPLDDTPFGVLKNTLSKKYARKTFIQAIWNRTTAELDLSDMYEAEKSSFSKQVIISSWINTGMASPSDLSKLDYDKIRLQARKVSGTASKSQVAASLTERATTIFSNFLLATPPPKPTTKPLTFEVPAGKSFNADELEVIRINYLAEKQAEADRKASEAALEELKKNQQKEQKEAAKAQKELEKEEQKKRKEAAREVKRLSSEMKQTFDRCLECKAKYKNQPRWKTCAPCASHLLCPAHSKNSALLRNHRAKCKDLRLKKARLG